MVDTPKRRPLKMELDPTDENLLAQLVGALERIVTGLEDIKIGIDELTAKVDEARLSSMGEQP